MAQLEICSNSFSHSPYLDSFLYSKGWPWILSAVQIRQKQRIDESGFAQTRFPCKAESKDK